MSMAQGCKIAKKFFSLENTTFFYTETLGQKYF